MMRANILLGMIFVAAAAFAQNGPEGHWDGSIKLPDREMPFALDLAKSAKGDWIGSFGVPAQKLAGVEISKIQAADKKVSFVVSGLPNRPEFNCNLGEGAQMNCDVVTSTGAVTANLKRTGEAKVELPATSPAVSKELEGDWDGSIETPNGTLALVMHLINQPDKTVKATVDSPAQNAAGLVLTSIVQTPTTLEFKLPMVNGSYKGTINKTSTEIAGEWTQGGKSVPLKFVKKAK